MKCVIYLDGPHKISSLSKVRFALANQTELLWNFETLKCYERLPMKRTPIASSKMKCFHCNLGIGLQFRNQEYYLGTYNLFLKSSWNNMLKSMGQAQDLQRICRKHDCRRLRWKECQEEYCSRLCWNTQCSKGNVPSVVGTIECEEAECKCGAEAIHLLIAGMRCTGAKATIQRVFRAVEDFTDRAGQSLISSDCTMMGGTIQPLLALPE